MSNVFVVTSTAATGADKDPRIGYENQLIAGTITKTASHDTAGADFLVDGITTQKWGPANTAPTVRFDGNYIDVDFIGIVGTNWDSANASVVVRDAPGGNILANISGLNDNQPAFAIITKSNYSTLYFEFTASNTSLEVGEIYAGEAMLLPRNVSTGYQPGRWTFSDDISFSRTKNNQFGPSTVSDRGTEERFTINFVDTSYMETTWKTFISAARGKPIFFLWNKDNSNQAIYGHWTISDPSFTSSLYSSIRMTVNGVV